MRDYRTPWNRNQHHLADLEIRDSNPWATLLSVIAIGALLIICLHALVSAIEQEVTHQNLVYSQPSRPEAFRKGSPTHDQMWHLDHITQVQSVMKAGGK